MNYDRLWCIKRRCWRNYASPGVLRPVALAKHQKESTQGVTVGESIARSKNTREQRRTRSSNMKHGINAQHLYLENNIFKGKHGKVVKSDASPKKVAK